VVKGKGQF